MNNKKGTIAIIALVVVAIIMGVFAVKAIVGNKASDEEESATTESTSQEIGTAEVLTDEFGNLLVTDENGEVVTDEDGSTKTETSTEKATTQASTTAAKGDVLYIGRHEKTLSSSGNSASQLLSAMAQETGWNLNAAGISSNSSTVYISWASSCSIYTGTGMTATNTYYCSDQESLDAMILDSVKSTMQKNLGVSYVYFSDANGNNIELSDVDTTIDADHPYSSFSDYQEFEAN